MKLAIVHDFLNQYGGAERVVEALHELFPDAPIYTSIYLPKNLPDSFRKMDIRTSFMQRLPLLNKHFKKYLLLYPAAMKSFDLSGYDVLLSSSSAFAKGAKKALGACHICYCYTPMRFAWNYDKYMEKENISKLVLALLPPAIKVLKKWDLAQNKNVDHFIAISGAVQERIRSFYGRNSDIIYPPVNIPDTGVSSTTGDYFLIVSRLNAYKRIDIAIEACNREGLRLVVIGSGAQKERLSRLAGPTVEFLGSLPDTLLNKYYAGCRALIFPGEEDFGIVPIEAQAFGKPVIAYAAGGALETVIEGKSGLFFKVQNPESLADALRRFIAAESSFDGSLIRSNAKKFDKEIFKDSIKNFIKERCEKSR